MQGVAVGLSWPGWSCVPHCPPQRCSGVGRTPSRTVTSLDSSSWAGPPSICLWCAALEHPHPSSSPSLSLALYPEPQGRLELSPHPRAEPSCAPYPAAAPPSTPSLCTAEPHPARPGVPGGPAPAAQHQGRGELRVLRYVGVVTLGPPWWCGGAKHSPPGYSRLRVRLAAGAWQEGPWHPPCSGCCCTRGGSRAPRAPGADAVPAGECCLAVRSAIGTTAQQFETFLFHRGEETGSVRGWMRVRVPRGRRGTRERLYGNGGRTQPPPGALGSGTPWATLPSGPWPWGEARPRCLCRVDQL